MTTKKDHEPPREESRFYLVQTASRVWKKIEKKVGVSQKNLQKKFQIINQKTHHVYNGIENDVRLVADDVIALGKENMDKIPMKKAIEEKIILGIASLPAKLNLPSKGDIEHLVSGIDRVNEKLDALGRKSDKR
ncbi:MAG: hypothetical protein MI862_12690 [Desulfobacterales bacterium]|nr:hypothetical protein [Desulfobacterales bacterium]